MRKKALTIETLRKENMIIFEALSGSQAYGLATPESDTDIKGVFIMPREDFYGFDYTPQVCDESNDTVFYELKRFMELLTKNNPNLMEMLYVDSEFIITSHPLYRAIKPELFISRLCRDTFAGYAMGQIKKARGLKKKILNPMDKEKKSILDFCKVIKGSGSIKISPWLAERGWDQKQCGLVNIPGMKNIYSLFYDDNKEFNFSGLIKNPESMDVTLSSVPKKLEPRATLYCNIDGYSRYLREYGEYWTWVTRRNAERYKGTMSHGKKYDAKNMMHTFRLLEIAEEIAKTGSFTTRRSNREELLSIKRGDFEYVDLMNRAKIKMEEIKKLFEASPLPPAPDRAKINDLLVSIRKEYYKTLNPH